MNDYPFFFTWTAQKDARPLNVTGGEGAWFTTSDGGRWLDLGGFIYQINVGHGNKRMVEAVQRQAASLCVTFPEAVYPAKVELAEHLLRLAPKGFTKVFFTVGGAEATENALKIARLVTGRFKVLSRYRSYHGATMGAITLTGDERRPPVEPGIAGVVHVLDFDCAACPYGVRSPTCTHEPLTYIPRILELEGPSTVAAVFVEAVVGANGVLIPPPGYMRRIREACDRHGVLLVIDEVLTGFGRTGRCFAFEHFDGVVPDMITIGKALTGGYGTLGGVLVNERIAAHFAKNRLEAGLTHYAHPLAVAAGVEALRILEEEKLSARAAAMESTLRDGLESMRRQSPRVVRQSRVIGLLSATELELSRDEWGALRESLERRRIHVHLYSSRGLLVLSPPLCIREEELRHGLTEVAQAVAERKGRAP